MEHCEERFRQLTEGKISLTPAELFELAGELATLGKYREKAEIYENYIANHIGASALDLFRVQTYSYDLIRRQGEPLKAVELFKGMEMPEEAEPMVVLDFHQAFGQAYLKSGQAELALKEERKILLIPDFWNGAVPADKVLYIVETMIGIKRPLGQFDSEMIVLFGRYHEYLSKLEEGPHKSRAAAMLDYLYGLVAYSGGQFAESIERLNRSIDKFPAIRNQAFSAMLLLSAATSEGPHNAEVDETTAAYYQRALEFYKNFANELMPTDVQEFPEEYKRANALAQIEGTLLK